MNWNTSTPISVCVHVTRRQASLLVSVILIAAVTTGSTSTAGTATRDRAAESAFLARHWRVPIPPQGPAPAR
jgi:hypothetical protein